MTTDGQSIFRQFTMHCEFRISSRYHQTHYHSSKISQKIVFFVCVIALQRTAW